MSSYKSYVSYFVSFLLKELNGITKIKRVILFGSVAREDAKKDSDIDIFIDLIKEDIKLKEKIKDILESFYKSRESIIFKNQGISNKINLIIDKLENWPDLKPSIESDGIVFYGNFVSTDITGRKQLIISWDKIIKNRGAFLNKIYGFKSKGKEYSGLIEKLEGKKIGKSSVMIPIQNKKEIFDLIKKYKVKAKVIEIYA